ncbi:hypothetical protein PGT21_014480 [Puccinia graminis f. sp. tritici]|uniref:Uncharacterized protein n=1 Tax=Puccinia graminis f. sp. tritici TaxID=56615 RepID=A0A5B0M2Q1_PUCGR|nr:hypothetical protein PGT21_014480 [Puccinia graminis f. sp. tritici]
MLPQGFLSRKVRFVTFLRPLCQIANPPEAKKGYPCAFWSQMRNGGHLYASRIVPRLDQSLLQNNGKKSLTVL